MVDARSPSPESPVFRDAFPILQAGDVDRLARFYVEAFGFQMGYRFPQEGAIDYVFLKLAPLGIGIASHADGMPPARQPASFELWIYADDADAAVDQVIAAGATLLQPASDQPWGERVALVADPEGNRIRIGAVSTETRG
jgi:predicted enzyme related to lactoylglutathione lyase